MAPDLAAEIDSLHEDARITDELERLKSEMAGGTATGCMVNPGQLANCFNNGSMTVQPPAAQNASMEFWKFMFVPTILFLVIVAPMWITMHYRSVNRASGDLPTRTGSR